MPVVVEDPILSTGVRRESVHRRLDNARQRIVAWVYRLTALEIHIGILSRAPQGWPVGRKGPAPKIGDGRFFDHRSQRGVLQRDDFADFVRGAKPVEEVDEGQSGFQ